MSRWFSPPSFEGDGETLRRAALLNTILIGSILFLSLLIVGIFLGSNTPQKIAPINLIMILAMVLIRRWLFAGRVELAAVATSLVGLVGITVVTAHLGTIRTTTAANYLFWILAVGALFRLKGLVLAVLTASMAILGLILAENAGWLPAPEHSVGVTQWIAYTTLFALSAGLTYHTNHLTRRALAQAEREVVQRQQTQRELIAAKNGLRGMLDALPDLLFEVDGEGRIYDYRSPRSDLLAVPAEMFLNRKFSDFLPAPASDVIFAALREAERDGTSTGKTYALDLPQKPHWFEISVVRKPGSDGVHQRYICLARDVTERKTAEEELRIAATAFESQQGMTITDGDKVILRVNKAFTEITGYSAQEVLGKTPHTVLGSGRHDDGFYAAMWDSVSRTGVWQGEIWNRRKNGEIYPQWLSISAVKNEAGTTTHYVEAFSDISLAKAAEQEIQTLAFSDLLTGLPNRRLFMDRLKQALTAGARHQRLGALLFVDLDNFKTLNETLGHESGDVLLKEVAKRLRRCVRESDTVARIGGDEFILMLEDLSHLARDAAAQAEAVGEKVLLALNQPYQFEAGEHYCTASMGLTLFGVAVNGEVDPLMQAELAMYQAKAAGRNLLRFFDPQMQASVSHRVALEAALHEALIKNQFVLHYQAQVTESGHIYGAEALLRWLDPRRGMVMPAEFIALAEESNLIVAIGQWVLQTACQQVVQWERDPALAHLVLSVNVSARQFHQQDFVEQVLRMVQSTGANPQRLKLELTESLLVTNVEDVVTKMNVLKGRGMRFSIDDFGTGYSSLSHLKRLPLDQLKIDQGFVRDILIDPNDAAIAGMVIALGNSLGLEVIAEGVETQAQRDFLAQLGCQHYQGYLFCRPLPVAEFESLVRRGVTPLPLA